MRYTAITIRHPLTGKDSTAAEIADQFGLTPHIIHERRKRGDQGLDLIVRPDKGSARRKQIAQDEKRKEASERLRRSLEEHVMHQLRTPAGRLATHLFRDYRKACR